MAAQLWCHTHVGRLRAGRLDVISVKVPGERIGYRAAVRLRLATFRVSRAGRERCLATGVRNVHAWVVGEEMAGEPVGDELEGFEQVWYDPWKGEGFVRRSEDGTYRTVGSADEVVMIYKSVFARGLGE